MKSRLLTSAVVLTVFWYLTSCVLHLFSLRPLWHDEACVFISLKSYSDQDFFTKVLAAYQVFPRTYLFWIQKISQPFHFHVVSLRLLPFLAMLGAFFVWLKMASDEFKNKSIFLTFVLCWGASVVLIYYAAELKQYSLDVLTAALFVFFLTHQEKWEEEQNDFILLRTTNGSEGVLRRIFCSSKNNSAKPYHRSISKAKQNKYFLILLILPALVLFSYTAYFFVLFPLINLLLSWKEKKGKTKFLAGYAGSLLIFSFLSYYFDLRLRAVEAVTTGFHDYFISFESFPEFLRTLTEGTHNLFSRWFVERPKILKGIGLFFTTLGFLRMFYGFSKNFRQDRFRFKKIDTIALIVFLELFLAGALKKYPFSIPRTSLFFCPIIFWLTVKAIEDLQNWNAFVYRLVLGSFIYFLVFVSLGIAFFVWAGVLTFRPALW